MLMAYGEMSTPLAQLTGSYGQEFSVLFFLTHGVVTHVRHFAATSFSLSQQLCTVDSGIFHMAAVNVILLVN